MGRGLDGYFFPRLVRGVVPDVVICAVLRDRRRLSRVSGGYGEGETPLPIPNREVKPLSADGTWPARARESRTPPV
jgi:hypothetical protein